MMPCLQFCFYKIHKLPLTISSNAQKRGADKTAHVFIQTQIHIVSFGFHLYANPVIWASVRHQCRQTKLKFIMSVCRWCGPQQPTKQESVILWPLLLCSNAVWVIDHERPRGCSKAANTHEQRLFTRLQKSYVEMVVAKWNILVVAKN